MKKYLLYAIKLIQEIIKAVIITQTSLSKHSFSKQKKKPKKKLIVDKIQNLGLLPSNWISVLHSLYSLYFSVNYCYLSSIFSSPRSLNDLHKRVLRNWLLRPESNSFTNLHITESIDVLSMLKFKALHLISDALQIIVRHSFYPVYL